MRSVWSESPFENENPKSQVFVWSLGRGSRVWVERTSKSFTQAGITSINLVNGTNYRYSGYEQIWRDWFLILGTFHTTWTREQTFTNPPRAVIANRESTQLMTDDWWPMTLHDFWLLTLLWGSCRPQNPHTSNSMHQHDRWQTHDHFSHDSWPIVHHKARVPQFGPTKSRRTGAKHTTSRVLQRFKYAFLSRRSRL